MNLIEKFLFNKRIFVLGRNKESLAVSKKIDIKGIVDDFCEVDFNGIKRFMSLQLNKNDVIINCSSSISPISTLNHFKSIGIIKILNYSELVSEYDLPLQEFVYQTKFAFENQNEDFKQFRNDLFDYESLITFDSVLNFRLSGDISNMFKFSVNVETQYLEDFVDFNNKVFLDVGGFDGDTTELFFNNTNISSSHIFEPSKINLESAKNRLKDFERVTYHNFGLSNKCQSLYFSDGEGSSSKISNSGDLIEFRSLDSLNLSSVGILKIDVEGHDLQVLEGAHNTLIKYKPLIMVAIYHSGGDFIGIYKYLKSLGIYNKFYLRHYTEGWSETILFCE